MFKTYFLLITLYTAVLLSAQCTGNFGNPIFNEDFGYGLPNSYGNPLASGITTYLYRSFTDYRDLQDGEYTIVNNPNLGRTEYFNTTDHTIQMNAQPNGYMFLVNAAYDPGEFYRQRVYNLCHDQTYELSFFVMNVLPDGLWDNQIPINVGYKIYDNNNNVLNEGNTGNIFSSSSPIWHEQSFEFDINTDQNYVDIVLVNNGIGGVGNDLAIDDIQLKPCQSGIFDLVANIDVFTTGVDDNLSSFEINVQSTNNTYNQPYYILQQSSNSGQSWNVVDENQTGNFTVIAGSYAHNNQFRVLISETSNAGNLNCSILIGPETVIINQVQNDRVLTICDDDYDGIATFDLSELQQQLQNSYGDEENELDEVYIANSYQGLIKIENVSNNPNRVNVCNSNFSLYEVAVNQQKEVFVSGQNGLFKVNIEDCSFQNVGSLPFNSNISASFDTQNNFYVGGFHSSVYRADAGQFNNYYEWHNFDDGSSGGDFVVIGEFMYIAWALNDDYYLYKVTLDEDNGYVSHVNLGSIPTDTFGMAAENGILYGVTPDYLYKINLDDMTTEQVIQNSGSNPWWGAAGLHEAIAYEVTFHLNATDAQNGVSALDLNFSNTTAFNQIIFIRVYNQNTGQVEVINLELIVNIPPQTQPGVLNGCLENGQTTTSFDLNLAVAQMLPDSNGTNISFHSSQQNAANNSNPISDITNFQPTSLPATIYVRFDNGCTVINTLQLTADEATINLPNTISFCEGESTTLSINQTFDTYEWNGLQGMDISNNDINSNEITITNPGTYTVTVTYGNDCETSKTITVTEETLPTLASQNISFCASESTHEINSNEFQTYLNNQNSNYVYEIYNSNTDAENGNNQITGSLNVADNQNFVIKVKNSVNSDCYILSNLNVNLNPNPEFVLEENYQICEGEILNLVIPNEFVSYNWSGIQPEDAGNDSQSNEVNLTQSGSYSVIVANENCSLSKSFVINYGESAIINSVTITGNSATVTATGTGELEYSLDGISWQINPNFSNLENSVYTVYVRGAEVCGVTERSFAIFEITNVITPNGDGLNDAWEIKGISAYPEASIQIYNRYGKMLMNKKADSDILWDGNYKGSPVTTGTYWYIIKIPDGRSFSGHLTVKNY